MKRTILSMLILLLFLHTSAAGEERAWQIKKGDTLTKVSRESGVPVNVLADANGITDPSALKVGAVVRIPAVHIVRKGETLYGISRRYGVTVDELARLNRLSSARALKIDQRLYLPLSAKTVVHTAPVRETDDSQTLFWPISGTREPYNGKIRGVLISGNKGDLVYSVSSGRVIWAGPYRGFGNVILVSATDDLVFGYLGTEELIVSVGEQIEAGSALGRLGLYFHQSNAKLLFIVYHNLKRTYLDPQQVLSTFQTK